MQDTGLQRAFGASWGLLSALKTPTLVLAGLTVLISSLVTCAPVLRNPPADDDDVVSDDDDTTSGEDPCCEHGDEDHWESCADPDAAACVCTQDAYCCEKSWDETCADLYLSPCGATGCAAR